MTWGAAMLKFEWDNPKAIANRRKHGVSFDTAATAFGDALSLTIADASTMAGEARFILLGQTPAGELLVVVHVVRNVTIRLISARPATRRERMAYEQGG